MLDKIKNFFSFTFTKTMEYRIRRVIELTTLGTGSFLIISALVRIIFFSGTFTGNIIELTIGLIAIQIAYKGLVEDLPRVGALASKRRFWE